MRRRARIALSIVAALVALLVVGGAVAWRAFHVSDLVNIGVGYSAQQTCACMFISGRPFDSCHKDLDPLAQLLISVQPGANEVTARSLGLVRATARFDKAFGCSLLP